MRTVTLAYNDLSKWQWNSDKTATVYVDGVKMWDFSGIRPKTLLKIVRKRLGVKKVHSSTVQKINPLQKAKSDLEFMVMDACCPVEIFWENVGTSKTSVLGMLVDISKIEDEHEYRKALRSLMNEFI